MVGSKPKTLKWRQLQGYKVVKLQRIVGFKPKISNLKLVVRYCTLQYAPAILFTDGIMVLNFLLSTHFIKYLMNAYVGMVLRERAIIASWLVGSKLKKF